MATPVGRIEFTVKIPGRTDHWRTNMAGRLEGAVAIVTAGGQGIGDTISTLFAREGAAVAVVDINRAEGERVLKGIESAGGKAVFLETDCTRTDAVNAMVKSVVDRWGTVDVLVNAAGGFHQLAQITDITDEEWDRVITLNLKTCFLCSRAVAGIMMAKKK